MILEDALPSDIPAVAALMNLAFRGTGPVQSWNAESFYIAGDRISVALLGADVASKPDARLLLVRDPATRTPIASVWLEPSGDGTWYLGSLTIHPARQNGGAGRTMLAAVEDWVRARGGRRIRMTVVNLRDTLIAWYLRRGYRLTGETEPFPYDDARFGVPLRDDLHFVVLDKTLSLPPATSAA
jgi:GNAT superfamily N-acetyltransferase